jgi:hypothetical protein
MYIKSFSKEKQTYIPERNFSQKKQSETAFACADLSDICVTLGEWGFFVKGVGESLHSLQWCPKAVTILKSQRWRDASGSLEMEKPRMYHRLATGIPLVQREDLNFDTDNQLGDVEVLNNGLLVSRICNSICVAFALRAMSLKTYDSAREGNHQPL